MDSTQERFASFVSLAGTRNGRQFRLSILIAAVIGMLLWRTQWPPLRPGLLILLGGQLAMALAYLHRSRHRTSNAMKTRAEMLRWAESEEHFVSLSTVVEGSVRLAGFLVLAWGFWRATHMLWMALLLGLVYPTISYFGVARRNSRQINRLLQRQKIEIKAAA